jgi:hypothetical protein
MHTRYLQVHRLQVPGKEILAHLGKRMQPPRQRGPPPAKAIDLGIVDDVG